MSYFQISNQAPTITDWIQSSIFILTAIGLFANFWYQRRSLWEQNRLRFIEEERDRRAIMPFFEFKTDFDTENVMYTLIFTLMDNPCKFLMISALKENLKPYFVVNTGLKKDEQVILKIPRQIISEIKIDKNEPIFKIDYMDKESRPYVQNLHLAGLSMFVSEPVEYQYIKMVEDLQKKKRFWFFHKRKPKV